MEPTLDRRRGLGRHITTHFAVTPIDWSAQWVEDRITRKLREAGAR